MGKRLAPGLRDLDSREERLDEMLCRYQEAQETLVCSDVRGGSEGNVTLMPLCWNMSYRKLEVLVKYMAVVAETATPQFRSAYVHLREWYWRGEWRRGQVATVDQVTRKKRTVERMVFRPGPRADARLVLVGVEWLSGHFPGEIYLPREFLDVAA